MGDIPYSNRSDQQSIDSLTDTNIALSISNGDVLAWNAATLEWINSAGGGGGGATISGTDADVVFKSGTNGDTFTGGITRTPATAGKCINLDTTNKRVAINGINPTKTFEVNGVATITDGANKLEIDGQELGLVSGVLPLSLYSANLSTGIDPTLVDSVKKNIQSSGLFSYYPAGFDAPNTTDTDAIYKIKLRRGMDLWSGVAPFSRQNNFNSLGVEFPTGQVVESQNKKPIQYPAILSRTATGVAVLPATTYVISLYGTYSSFQDTMIYDPTGMRAFINPTNGWTTAAAPSLFRTEDTKCLMRVKWNFKGRWSGSSAQNRAEIYVNQYRGGGLLRTFQVAISNNDDTCIINGERTFIGFNSAYGEDFNCSQDWYEIEVANMSVGNSITADYAHTEVEFILAQ